MMEVLNVKVEKGTKEKVERLVKARGYKNKSEAVRSIIKEHLEEHPEYFGDDDLAALVAEAEQMSEEEFDRLAALVFKGPKSAAELVAEGRER